ncbi:SAM-dependent methyltransferase [Actinomadura sp. 7K507]|uniref:SAM-dependent methyltransferase n=1 Tax=Actinomadura sp. 7K507 TaxID=2530365 RepID=UPI00104374F3|nr:SAM-dependent methyltransferase [Actinomadura sp. 7K507]TDC81849.1 methyltransferase domain-containing protein [Actinomadura sp. 7K507]
MTGQELTPGRALDFTQASPARTYNALLKGRTAYASDREAADKVIAMAPDAGQVARENFQFAGRAAAWAVAEFGIGQVADIGVGVLDADIGLPSVEECVLRVALDARVVAFDNDPVVLAHARSGRSYGRVLHGDVTDLDTVFGNLELGEALDRSAPTVVVLAAVLHFVADPAAVMAELGRRLAPGSVVVLSHATTTDTETRRVDGMTKAYDKATSRIRFRSEEEILGLVDGWDMVAPPGLCDVAEWGLPEPHDGQVGEHVRVVGLVAVRPGRNDRGRER